MTRKTLDEMTSDDLDHLHAERGRLEIANRALNTAALEAVERAERAEAETKKWLAFIERGMDTHMQFSVIRPDGTTEQLPCADWCYACRIEKGEAALTRVRALRDDLRETTGARYIADALDKILGDTTPGPGAPNVPRCAVCLTPVAEHAGKMCARRGQPEADTLTAPVPVDQHPDVLRERAETDMHAITEAEAVRQLDADPHGLKAGMIVKAYREHGHEKWVFRCWGTSTCDGLLSLDHSSRQGAERARDRHVAEDHDPKEQP
ncbi:hypothetical protein [Streptomyces sp. NPDC051016]|uniref:hypothetical protein n=1 Tax=Streptomyces sp. NPDC051016 TaxID=3365638 RepID=UPI0037BD3FE3